MTDLNRLSAEKIMGWVKHPGYPHVWFEYVNLEGESLAAPYKGDWTPLTDLNQCFMVVEKMRERRKDGRDGYNFNLNWQAHKGIEVCLVQFHRIDGSLEYGQGSSINPNEAILTAALKAKGVEVD